MIVSKYATSSLDIHFLLSLANQVDKMGNGFRDNVIKFV